MKNNIIISAAIFLAILIGFSFAWMIKPASEEAHNHVAGTSQSTGDAQIYTCSMHPQIRQNEMGICPICEMDLIPLDENASEDPLVLSMTEAAVGMANIQTTVIESGGISGNNKEITLTGRVKADETRVSTLVAHVPGRIEKLYISYTGEKVTTGQKLADIYSPDLIAAQQELLEAKKLINVNEGLLEAAKAKIKNWKITDEMINQILETEKIIETFTFFAESSGIVSERKIALGDYVRRGEVLFELMNLSKVWVVFDAYESDLSNIRTGDRIQFSAPAIGSRTFTTNVSFIDPVIDPKTRTVAIRTEVNNQSGLLKPEMFVNGKHRKAAGKSAEGLLIPKSAILWTGKRSVVYVKDQENEIPSFRYKEIVLGERVGDYYIVTDGLEEGEEVVTNGAFTIDAAAQLNNQASMMNKGVVVKGEQERESIPDFIAETPEAFQVQLSTLLDNYISVKNAMVATDSGAAKEAAIAFKTTLETVNMTLIKGKAHMYWMEQLNALSAHIQIIIDSNDIEDQRKQFEFLSAAMIKTIKAFGVQKVEVYVQFCPMAFDNKGAEWISLQDVIQNPYFGDKMMKCGVIRDNIGKNTNQVIVD